MSDPQRWECRYSSSEMLYLELRGQEVITYLYHAPNNPDRYPFADVLAGKQDAMISQLFGAAAVDEVKAAIVAQRDALTRDAPPPLTKQQLRERRRQEQQADLADRKRVGWPGRQGRGEGRREEAVSVGTMAIVAGVILTVLVIGPVVIALIPSRQHDPQEGMAVGCLMMFSFAMLLPAGLLAWGHFGGHPALVKVIFWTLAAVVAYVAVAGTAMTVVRWRKQRRWR